MNMHKLVVPALMILGFTQHVKAQTLFTYGNKQVDKNEFIRVYKKNSIDKNPDMSKKALSEYLNLYTLYKMKVNEAQLQKLDTLPNIKFELDSYKKQIAKNYLTDQKITDELIKEAYGRKKEEVNVAHILVMVPRSAYPEDSVAHFNKIDSIYKAIKSGKLSFEQAAKNYSDDTGTKDNGGKLGYITSLQMVYPFENAAYNTKKGEISAPFRTQFGYHIVKVLDKRPSRGEVKVAQILLLTPESKGAAGVEEAKQKAAMIESELKAGAKFEDLVQKYSEDRFTKDNNGELEQFGSGRMVPEFEEASFALSKPGDISKPIKTQYGYHIIKLIDKYPVPEYNAAFNSLKRQVESDQRSQIAKENYLAQVRKDNKYVFHEQAYKELESKFATFPDTGANANKFDVEDFKSFNKPLFSLGSNNYTQTDFVNYLFMLTRGNLSNPRNSLVYNFYKRYETDVINDYQEDRLSKENPEFKQLMSDYKDGIMLFELMDKKVWSAASKDTAGLKEFYNRTDKYQWKPGFRGEIYKVNNEANKNKLLKLLEVKNITPDSIYRSMNTEGNQEALTMRNGYFEFSEDASIPSNSLSKSGSIHEVKNSDGSFTIYNAREVYHTNTKKLLNEARGYVTSDYQSYLETKWNEELRAKYPVKVDEKVFSTIVK